MPDPMLDHGLTPAQIILIRDILTPYSDKIEQVGVFGSRATGTFRPNSGIDLVVYGTVEQADIDRLWTLFDASSLAIKVDLNAYHLLAYSPLRAHIDEVMQVLFQQDDLKS